MSKNYVKLYKYGYITYANILTVFEYCLKNQSCHLLKTVYYYHIETWKFRKWYITVRFK